VRKGRTSPDEIRKARKEPQFRFYAPYEGVCRMDVLEAAWKHVGKKGKAAGFDGVRTEDILGKEGGVDEFAATDFRHR
jgi:RNA-directed DNA polymerase